MIAEAQPYTPTTKEINSLQVLKNKWRPDGSHDLLEEETVVEKSDTPFAFDLSREYALAQEFGSGYKKLFIENAHYYAKESFGKVPVSEYEHKIMTLSDGRSRLVLGPDNTSARKSYLDPALDTSKPEWYRKRSMGDVRWVDSMEEKLQDAVEGDTFIDLSPTEYDVSVEERKKWGYGYHSFARVHKVVVEGGQKKLVSRAVRNYLDAPEQEELFKNLTGKEARVDQLLGRVEKVNPATSQAYIKAISEKLYDITPGDRKIIPPQEIVGQIKSEEEMDDALLKIDVWLMAIYEMMEWGEDPQVVLEKFRGWENAVKDYIDGKDILEKFEDITIDEMRIAIYGGNALVTDLVGREYEAGMNGCGLGSGLNEVPRTYNVMTYESMTATSGPGENCPEIKCGGTKEDGTPCGWKANDYDVYQITNGRMKSCPRCGWKP